MPSVQSDARHNERTARRGLAYVFTPKHHGAGRTDACWLTELTLDEEFAIFDRADGRVVPAGEDARQVSDEDGNVYGYERLPEGADRALRELGTWQQQLAEFPVQVDGADWHGYPIWPVDASSPQNRGGHKCRPAKCVFDRMYEIGDIDHGQRKRLMKGDWI